MFRSTINKILRKVGYQFIRTDNLKEIKEQNDITRFSLNSGERQVATKIENIRRDHVVRYEMVSKFLLNSYSDPSALFGGDIFCGNGYGSNLISTKTNCFIFGIDASKEAINLAKEYYSNYKTFFSEKLFPFNLPKNQFDFVVSFETIEHVPEDHDLIQEFVWSLKPGGYLFISAPNENVCSFSKNNYKFHFKHYRLDELISILSDKFNLQLINWYGNGAFQFTKGVKTGNRLKSEMNLKEKQEDSHLTLIFKKKKI